MDDSLQTSFRWLDEEGDLDLSLDEYPTSAANSSYLPQQRKPSFRRTLSLNSVNLRKRAFSRTLSFNSANTASKPGATTTGPEQTSIYHAEAPYSVSNINNNRPSVSRPPSRSYAHHVSRSSTSSIDPYAQYYQDPEARLKLRIYLASPQNFDEAIEFGFPALESMEPSTPGNKPTDPIKEAHKFNGTFLEDDETSVSAENIQQKPNISRVSYVFQDPQDLQDFNPNNNRNCDAPAAKTTLQQHKKMREMTLRMTLTRPDLRTNTPPTPGSPGDPLEVAELSPVSLDSHLGELDIDDDGLMRKFWRKLYRRKG